MIVIDTNVLSEAMRAHGDQRVRSALARWHADIYLSVVVLGELVFGIDLLPRGRRKAELQAHYDGLKTSHSDRILDVTDGVTERWGLLRALHQRSGRKLAFADGLIAATALDHGFALMTRNTRDFELTGVRLINPWED